MHSNLIRQLGRTLLNFGIDPRKLTALKYILRYISEVRQWRRMGGNITSYYPLLSDYDDRAGIASGHYFHQDLHVAAMIHEANPVRHIDIGSRMDGFVAHVASFREIEVFDVRPLHSNNHRIKFQQKDLMHESLDEIADSVAS